MAGPLIGLKLAWRRPSRLTSTKRSVIQPQFPLPPRSLSSELRRSVEQDLNPTSTSLPPEADETTIYTYIRTQSLYHLRTMRIYNRLISSPVPSAAELISLDDELVEGWRNSLPSYFRDDDLPLPTEYLLGHSISRWRYRLLRVIMYRPFLIRWAQNGFVSSKSPGSPSQTSTAEQIATSRCFRAADECIQALLHFWTSGTHTRLAAWYVL